MKVIDEKKIIKWIQKKSYSNLVFLSEEWRNVEHKWYLGFYYFIQYQKGEETDTIFNEIISRNSDTSSAYLYLAQTAKKIYDSLDNEHISTGYCREAIRINPYKAEAHWELYVMSNDARSYIRAIELEYALENYKQVSSWLNGYNIYYNHFIHLSNKDWNSLKSILESKKVEPSKKLLLWTYFNLNEFENCLALINEVKYVDFEIINAYYKKELICKESALAKLSLWQIEKLLEDDDIGIYVEYLKEAKKDKINPTNAVLIKKAFKAKAFGDIATYFNKMKNEDSFFSYHKESQLYYLLAQLELNQPLDKIVLNDIKNCSDSLDGESITLYQILQCKLKLLEVRERVSYDYPLETFAPYQDAINIIDKQIVVEHYLLDSLKKEIYKLKTEWYKSYNNKKLDILRAKLFAAEMTDDDFRDLHHIGIECHEYDYVIQSVNNYHKHTIPSTSSYNCMGVCYERKGDFESAFKYYKLAIELMLSLQEYSYIIISNYITCAERFLKSNIPEKELNYLRNLFNIDLINQFKWSTFTSKKYSHLFKYTSFSINTIDSLLNQYFYLAKKEQLNDPIELPNIEGVGAHNLIESNYRLCSLTNNEDSMLMWSHYAQEHQGIMIEYWFGGEFPSGVGVERVKYTDAFKRKNEEALYVFNEYILTKNSDWKYENEVRIFSNQVDRVNFDLFDYPRSNRSKINACVKSITLGYKFPDDKKELIFNIVSMINSKRRSHEPLVKIREAYIADENKFSLRYRDLINI